ncbi:MAG TPA: CAP domain-containing protein [Thermoleophilaceae bacterium]
MTQAKPSLVGAGLAGQATLCLLNRERTRRGLPALRENGLLSAASLEHSQDMVRRRYFEHTTPDGQTVGDRLRTIGYARGVTASAGENIAFGFGRESTPAAIVRIWMDSPGHRADILRPSFTEIGIGIAAGAPELPSVKQADSATYTTDFGGVFDPTLSNG